MGIWGMKRKLGGIGLLGADLHSNNPYARKIKIKKKAKIGYHGGNTPNRIVAQNAAERISKLEGIQKVEREIALRVVDLVKANKNIAMQEVGVVLQSEFNKKGEVFMRRSRAGMTPYPVAAANVEAVLKLLEKNKIIERVY